MRFLSAKRLAATLGFMAIPMFATACGGIKEKDFPKEQAETICDLIVECNCFYDPAGTKTECIETWIDYGQAVRELADLDQLKYDDECAEENLNDLDSLGCDASGWEGDSCSRPCKLYYGPTPSGGTCTSGGAGIDNCQQGLSCSGGICVNPCEEPNWPSAGESCYHGFCDDDAYCYQDASTLPICLAYPTTGLPCTDFGECAEGNYCDTANGAPGTCALLQTAGLPCDAGQQCEECLICDASSGTATCTYPPGTGMPCLNGACDAGLHCNANSLCESDVCLQWSPQGVGGTGSTTGTTDPTDTSDPTDTATTGAGAGCSAYGEQMEICLAQDGAAQADVCQQSIDSGYLISATCGDTYTGYFDCLATADCAELTGGTAAQDCLTAWDFNTACM